MRNSRAPAMKSSSVPSPTVPPTSGKGRHPVGPFLVSAFKDHIGELPFPAVAPPIWPVLWTWGEILCAAASSKGRSLVWLITDNENNLEQQSGRQGILPPPARQPGLQPALCSSPSPTTKVRKGDNV